VQKAFVLGAGLGERLRPLKAYPEIELIDD
jgi:choline kinase